MHGAGFELRAEAARDDSDDSVFLLAATVSGNAAAHPSEDLCAALPADCVDIRRGTDSNRDHSRGNTFPAT